MKRMVLSFLILIFFPLNSFAELSYNEWEKFKKDFSKKIGQKEETALEALKEAAGLDDPRVAELVISKALFQDEITIALKAEEILKGYKNSRTIEKIIELAERNNKPDEKLHFLRLLGSYGDQKKSVRLLLNTLGTSNWRHVSAALKSLASIKNSESTGIIKRTFKRYKDSNHRLALEAAVALQSTSGEDSPGFKEEMGFLLPKKVFSHKVAFLIGTSSSLEGKSPLPADLQEEKEFKKKKDQEFSRLSLVQYTLKKTISKLDSSTSFNVIAFSDRAKTWENECVRANSSHISSAESFVERLRGDNGFDLYGALKKAMQDKDLDTIYCICDSLPSGGYYDTAEKAYKVILSLNRNRYVEIHWIVLLNPPPSSASEIEKARAAEVNAKVAKYYKDLSQNSYGTYREYAWAGGSSSGKNTASSDKKKEPAFEIQKEKDHIPFKEWNRIQSVFQEAINDRRNVEKSADVVRKVASSDDERCAKLVIDKVLTGDELPLIEAALEGLKKCQKKATVEEVMDQFEKTSNKELKMLLLRVFSAYKNEKLERKLVGMLRSGSDWKIHSAVLQALKTCGSNHSLEILQKMIKNKNRRLAFEAAEAIGQISGNKPSGFETPSSGLIPPSPDSSEVLFAISLSESMGKKVIVSEELYKKITGKAFKGKDKKELPTVKKIEVAKHFLKEAIEALSHETSFTIAAFGTRVQFYESRTVKASSSAKRSAIKYLEKLQPSNGQNVSDLYKSAARMRDLDTIYILADGLPEGGYEDNPSKISQQIIFQNFSNLFRIHCRLILSEPASDANKVEQARINVVNKKVADFYRGLSEKNLGTFSSQGFPLKGD